MECMTKEQAGQLNPVVWAYVGDAVFTLFVRTRLVERSDAKAGALHAMCSRYVKAVSQSEMLEAIAPLLSEEEADIVRRGRNCHTANKAKNAGLAEYKRATALEALIGYLYLTGERDRLAEIENLCVEVME